MSADSNIRSSPGRSKSLRDEGRLVERLESARTPCDLGAVPVGRGKQVIGLTGDPRAHGRPRPLGLDVDPNERSRRAAWRARRRRARRAGAAPRRVPTARGSRDREWKTVRRDAVTASSSSVPRPASPSTWRSRPTATAREPAGEPRSLLGRPGNRPMSSRPWGRRRLRARGTAPTGTRCRGQQGPELQEVLGVIVSRTSICCTSTRSMACMRVSSAAEPQVPATAGPGRHQRVADRVGSCSTAGTTARRPDGS